MCACRSTCLRQILHPPNSLVHLLRPPPQWAYENSAFVWTALSRSNLSSTNDVPHCFTTYHIVNLAVALNSALGQILAVFSSKSTFLSSHSLVLIGGTLRTCPPITGARSMYQTSFGYQNKNTSCGAPCRRVSYAHDNDPRGRWSSTVEGTHFHHPQRD